jgi:hypothetical protein
MYSNLNMSKTGRNLLLRRRAASGFSYALAVGMIGVVSLLAVNSTGEEIRRIFDSLFGELPDVGSSNPDPGLSPPVITFAEAGLAATGLFVQTGTPFHETDPVPGSDPLSAIGFSVSDDTTPAADIEVSAVVTLDPAFANPSVPALPDAVLSGTGAQRSLAVDLDTGTSQSGGLIVTLTAVDADGLGSSASFGIRLGSFIVTSYSTGREIYAGPERVISVATQTTLKQEAYAGPGPAPVIVTGNSRQDEP